MVCFIVEDKLDGTNYSLWSFMVKNVLVAKGLWNYGSRHEERLCNVAPTTPTCGGRHGASVCSDVGIFETGLSPPKDTPCED